MTLELKLDDEEGRLRALDRYAVLDTQPEAPFEKIVGLVEQVMGVPICAVSLVDRHRQWFKAKRGLDVCETARDISFCTHAIKAPEPLIVCDASLDPRFAQNPLVIGPPFIRAYAGVPLRTQEGYNLGSLCAIDVKPRDFPATQIAILSSFAKLVVDELELRTIASSDHLSGALSRRAFTEQAANEAERASRYGRPLSLAILDIDFFKKVNDTHGHAAGDVAIKRVAEASMAAMRGSDALGRIGGEEFALLMPETTIENARLFAERLRATIEGLDIDAPPRMRVTVSIGVAEFAAKAEKIEDTLARADQALYAAKHGGRNRVEAASTAQSAATAQESAAE
jgi:diguanylate cyclase (GGDEF)-like protein